MDCQTCKKPVAINEKFVSGFDPDMTYFIKHVGACSGPVDAKKVKTMNKVRQESIATYHQLKEKKAAENLAAPQV